jgi:hypothetical protein
LLGRGRLNSGLLVGRLGGVLGVAPDKHQRNGAETESQQPASQARF